MLEDVKEFLESFNCRLAKCINCDNLEKCDKTEIFSEFSPEEYLNTIEEAETVIKEVSEAMPRKLVIPGIYKHFKHTEDGIPNNYMYVVIGIAEAINKKLMCTEYITSCTEIENMSYHNVVYKDKKLYMYVCNKKMMNCKYVIYKSLYDEIVWARPYDMFMSEVPEGKENPSGQKHRFELVRY